MSKVTINEIVENRINGNIGDSIELYNVYVGQIYQSLIHIDISDQARRATAERQAAIDLVAYCYQSPINGEGLYKSLQGIFGV